MRGLDAAIIRRQDQSLLAQPLAFRLIGREDGHQRLHIGDLEVVLRELDFILVVDVAIGHPVRPEQVEDVVHALQVHGDPLGPVGELGRDRIQFNPPHFLEIRELGDLHPVEPHLPPEPPGAERRRLPVVLHESDVVLLGIDAERAKALEIEVLDIVRRGFQDDLVLVVMLEAVGIFSIPPVRRPPAGLHVGRAPGVGAQDLEKRGRMERPRADFQVIGYVDDATLVGPKAMQGEEQILKGHTCILPIRTSEGLHPTQVRWELSIERPAGATDPIDCPAAIC